MNIFWGMKIFRYFRGHFRVGLGDKCKEWEYFWGMLKFQNTFFFVYLIGLIFWGSKRPMLGPSPRSKKNEITEPLWSTSLEY